MRSIAELVVRHPLQETAIGDALCCRALAHAQGLETAVGGELCTTLAREGVACHAAGELREGIFEQPRLGLPHRRIVDQRQCIEACEGGAR